jgi:ParB family transcriptional regulator, chromosome partitioning protein
VTRPADQPRRLGRGLEALIGPAPAPAPADTATPATSSGGLQLIPIAQIRPNPFQPRKDFSAADLHDLTTSLRASGLLQPITVRPTPSGYEVLAGERRLRAATQLGWRDISAIVKPVDDLTALTVALVENLQRTDLNPLEEAEGYARLSDDFAFTQQQIADAVGKNRSTVANSLRLLHLPAAVRALLRTGELTLGHARALLALGTEAEILAAARRIVGQGLTVRDAERMSRGTKATATRHGKATGSKRSADAAIHQVEDRLRKHLQTDVRIKLTSSDRGQLSILFYSNDDLERVLELILGTSRSHLSMSREAL